MPVAVQAASSYDAALTHLAKGDPRSARVELLNAIKANPADGRAHLLQGRVYLELGDGGAEAEIRRARETGVASISTHHLLAHALLLQNQPERAIEEAARSPQRFSPSALRIRGRAYAVLGQPVEAAAAFKRALTLAPLDPDLWSDFGRLLRATGDMAGAKTAADRAVALAPRDVDGLILQGDLARATGDLPKAFFWYDRALRIDRDNVPALLGRAGGLAEARRMRAMLAVTRQVLTLDESNPFALHLQARLAATAGKYGLARSLLQRTGSALDRYPAALLLAGSIQYRLGNNEHAIERLGRLVALQPSNLKARRVLGAAQWRAGDAYAAITSLKPVVTRPDADQSALTLMARALERSGDKAAAKTFRDRASQPNPQRLIEQVVAADRAMAKGQWRAAVQLYEGLREMTGDKDAAILNNLAWAYANTGQLGRALPFAASAFKLAPGNPAMIDSYGWFLHASGTDRVRGLQLLQTASAKMPLNPTIRWHLAQAYVAAGRSRDARRELGAALAMPMFNQRAKAEALLTTL
jgi:tetratricopeptide (TPR) repeat protein